MIYEVAMKKNAIRIIIILLTLVLVNASTDVGGDKRITKVYKTSSVLEGGAKGDAWTISINNVHIPYNNKGIIADVNYGSAGSSGRYPGPQGKGFLFSSGFFLSGYSGDELFANAVASASLVEDYLPGTIAEGSDDPKAQIYVVQAEDEPFGTAWQAWSDAVDLGADFYDGDGNGQYNPVDLNGNGEWDLHEDRPDQIGDEIGWTVYHDSVPADERRWNTVNPVGIEVRQSIFGIASADAIGNVVYIRYRIKYVGFGGPNEPEQLNDVYFGAWSDPDIGGTGVAASDDLIGTDVHRNAGFVYNDGEDDDWGTNPPSFMIDFLSGPVSYIPGETFIDVDSDGEFTDGIDTPLDTAYSIQGQIKGVIEFLGATNLRINSSIGYINGTPPIGDPDNASEARNFMLGRVGDSGEVPDPCDWGFGEVFGSVDCAAVNPNFWYSGDPVTQVGWINTHAGDQRMMTNTGPFVLKKGEDKEVMVAYVIGQGTDALSSITEVRRNDDLAQRFYDSNFDLTTNVEPNEEEIIYSYKLYQNYPNPFNPTTRIKYETSRSSDVRLKVYDSLGQEIQTLVDEFKPAGSYEVEFNASQLSNGVYFYELRTGDFRDVKKLILVK